MKTAKPSPTGYQASETFLAVSHLAGDSDQIIRDIDNHPEEKTFDKLFRDINDHPEVRVESSSTMYAVFVAGPMSVALHSFNNQDAIHILSQLSLIRYAVENYQSSISEEEITNLAQEWDLDLKHIFKLEESWRVNKPREGRCVINPFIIRVGDILPLPPYFVSILNYFKLAPT